MPIYEVKAWVTVQADDENEALLKAADLLDALPPEHAGAVKIEGEGSVYEAEDEE